MNSRKRIRAMALGFRGFPDIEGGIEKHAEHLYPRLAKCGCDVEVVVRSGYYPVNPPAMWRGVRFRRVWAPKTTGGAEAFIHTLLGVIYAAFARPDVLHIHAVGPALFAPLARLMGLKVVVTHHGADYERQKWGRIARCVLRLGEASGVWFSHRRIAISGLISNLIRAKYRRDSILIPNGVEISEPAKAMTTLAEFGLEAGKYVLQVSRLVTEKRQGDLIRAFRQANLVGWKLVLVGATGARTTYMEEILQAAATSPNVVCAGFQRGEALRQLYTHAGLFVLPSSHEGLPIALLEALSFGIPVLASAIPANIQVGLRESCYFPVGDVDALASKLREQSGAEFDAGERQARLEWVKANFDWDLVARQTLAVYKDVVVPTGRSRARTASLR